MILKSSDMVARRQQKLMRQISAFQLFIQIDEGLARRIDSFSLIVLFCSDLLVLLWLVCVLFANVVLSTRAFEILTLTRALDVSSCS